MRVLNWLVSPGPTLAAALDCLKQGGLVAFPTDTLYGLAADVMNDEAVMKLFQAKRRPLTEPLPILIQSIDQAGDLAKGMRNLALKLGIRFWPGPLTMVLDRSPAFQSLALAGGDSVALRIPDHDVPLALIRSLGRPVTGTSANRSGESPPGTAQEVIEQLNDDIEIVVDAGPCPLGIESTVVDLRNDRPRLLREGAISRQELESVAGVPFETGAS
jgi:L-threonylcarbamoyladenylate synthase